MEDGKLRYDVGSGIVLDSDGPDEYRECLLKSQIFKPRPEGVIETFRLGADGEIPRAKLHQSRFAKMVGKNTAGDVFTSIKQSQSEDRRVRMMASDGQISTNITPLNTLETPVKLSLSRYPLTPQMQETRFKTTARDFYDGERARISALTQANEIIFLNEAQELCEGSFTSLFVKKDGRLLTPDFSCGLLPGVLRRELIESKQAVEAKLTLADVQTADAIFVGNSLRGLIPAKFIDFLPH